jgi:hypothetical protein
MFGHTINMQGQTVVVAADLRDYSFIGDDKI